MVFEHCFKKVVELYLNLKALFLYFYLFSNVNYI